MKDVILSIVIIARNEQNNIGRCLISIHSLPIEIPYEIILIDSNSLDRTIDIAKKFQISIYRLNPKWHQNASTARYIGSKVSKGKYILFLDADMEVKRFLFRDLIMYLERDKSIGAISGKLKEFVYEEDKVTRVIEDRYKVLKTEQRLDMGGVFLIEKSILYKVGNFSVNLNANEDIELCYRLFNRGYKFMRVPEIEIIHHTQEQYSIESIKVKFKQSRYADMWRVSIDSFKYGLLVQHIKGNSFYYLWTILITFLVLFSILKIFNEIKDVYYLASIGLLLCLVIYKIIKRKSIRLAFLDFYQASLASISLFFIKHNPNNCSIDLDEIIKEYDWS